MWLKLLHVNSVLLSIAGVYAISSLGGALLFWSWKQFLIALVIFVFLAISEVVLAGIAEP